MYRVTGDVCLSRADVFNLASPRYRPGPCLRCLPMITAETTVIKLSPGVFIVPLVARENKFSRFLPIGPEFRAPTSPDPLLSVLS